MFESGPHLTFRSGSATEMERYLYEITSYENPEIRCIVTRFLGLLNPNVTPTKPFSPTVGHRSGSTGHYRKDGLYNFWRSPPRVGGGE